MTDPLLELRDVSVAFGGLHAVQGVSLQVAAGERVAVIGPNGAGKTTLMNCITGQQALTRGEVLLRGQSLGPVPTHLRARRGLGRTFQNLALFPSMSALENVLCALDPETHLLKDVLGQRRRAKRRREQAMESLALLGIDVYASVPAGVLPYGIRKLVELSRALVTEPSLLLLDEPVAGLADKAPFLETLVRGIDRIKCSVVLVEHDMPTVQAVAEHIYVLDAGRIIASGDYREVSRNKEVLTAYLGTAEDAQESRE